MVKHGLRSSYINVVLPDRSVQVVWHVHVTAAATVT